MLTDSVHQTPAAPDQPGLLVRLATRVRQAICGLHGHDALLHFHRNRMSLLCTSCGYESPGWEVKGSLRREDAPAAAQRPVRLPFVGARRAA